MILISFPKLIALVKDEVEQLMGKKVSIVLPIYNVEKYLNRCIHGLIDIKSIIY